MSASGNTALNVVALWLLTTGGSAVHAQSGDLVDCRRIADAEERLACYDRIVPGAAAESAATPSGPPAVAPVPAAPAAVPAPSGVPRTAGSADPAAVPPPAVPGLPAEELPGREAAPRGYGAPTEIRGMEIVDTRTTSTGRRQFRLANGELWEQIERRTTDLEAGDRVNLRQSPFGAWHLRDHDGAGRSVKVRRVDE